MSPQEAKTVADFLIADFENEMRTTVSVIEAVPDDHLDYQPDAKSKTGLGLVRHITLEDEWMFNCIANGEFVPPARRLRRLRNHDAGRRRGALPGQSSGGARARARDVG